MPQLQCPLARHLLPSQHPSRHPAPVPLLQAGERCGGSRAARAGVAPRWRGSPVAAHRCVAAAPAALPHGPPPHTHTTHAHPSSPLCATRPLQLNLSVKDMFSFCMAPASASDLRLAAALLQFATKFRWGGRAGRGAGTGWGAGTGRSRSQPGAQGATYCHPPHHRFCAPPRCAPAHPPALPPCLPAQQGPSRHAGRGGAQPGAVQHGRAAAHGGGAPGEEGERARRSSPPPRSLATPLPTRSFISPITTTHPPLPGGHALALAVLSLRTRCLPAAGQGGRGVQ